MWRLESTCVFYALLELPCKDGERILVRAPDGDWGAWDWEALAAIADGCRWRGPDLDDRWID